MRQCAHTNARGTQCRRSALDAATTCAVHAPGYVAPKRAPKTAEMRHEEIEGLLDASAEVMEEIADREMAYADALAVRDDIEALDAALDEAEAAVNALPEPVRMVGADRPLVAPSESADHATPQPPAERDRPTPAADYETLIARKGASQAFGGIEPGELPADLFPHQRDLVRWALRKGRAAIFADTGLGKTRMELEWARAVSRLGRVLILAPLAVAQQTVREGATWGVPCAYMREDDGVTPIVVANYEMLAHFDASAFIGVVLDESSILKAYTGATRNAIIGAFAQTPYRLAATATPAPNDFTELGNHSEFLGVKSRVEMLAEYFAHDGGSTQDWRIKGHAVAHFWRWVATWGAVVRMPSDLGHDDGAYRLPPLRMHEIVIDVANDHRKSGMLFADDAATLQEQREVRRRTIADRVEAARALAAHDGAVVIWCELNDEADACASAIPGAIQVAGSDSPETKADRLAAFADGNVRALVTKPSVAGFGLNWQHCARMIFLGASHSYEQTYQAIRRCWRFGQVRPVDVHIIRASTEGLVVENYRRKEADAARMGAEMAAHVIESVRAEVCGASKREWNPYEPAVKMLAPTWIGTESA